ncbi:MAG: hypothetical protein J6S97_02675 [Bacteroidales bacterium]|nr:hypothetical protein [Bacteroidales bacterium]
MMQRIIRFLFLCACCVQAVSCQGLRTHKFLRDIESYIDNCPDSALAALRGIDTLSLCTARLRAEYSLLSAIAFDKNYIDTTDTKIIEPAVEFFSRVGEKDHLMKAYYYRGLMCDYSNDRDNAIKDYTLSWDLAQTSNENYKFKGQICSALSRVYSYNHNSNQELLFALKAEECFKKAGDDYNVWIMQSIIPFCYGNTNKWDISDSLYNAFLGQDIRDTAVYANAMMNAVKAKVRKTEPEPALACELFEKALSMGAKPSAGNLSVYAYALEQNGNKQAVNSLLPILNHLKKTPKNFGVVNLWEYRIFKNRKEYEAALSSFENSVAAQDSMLIIILGQSLEKAQKDYYAEKASRLIAETKLRNTIFAIVLVIVLTLLVFVIYQAVKRRKEWIKVVGEAECLRNDLALLEEDSAKSGSDLSKLRKEYVHLFKEQFSIMDELCSVYWSPAQRNKHEKTLRVAVNAVKSISEKDNLESTINSHFDGVMTKLRRDLPNLSENTYRMICFFIIGFSGKTIAILMNVGVGTVYTTKNRIKGRIQELDSQYKEHYLELLS